MMNLNEINNALTDYIVSLPGLSTKFFTYKNKVFQANKSELNIPQEQFLVKGHVLLYNDTVYYNMPITNDLTLFENIKDYFLILKSEKTGMKALFNFKMADDSKYVYEFVSTYPFDKLVYQKMKGTRVIIHNI